MKTLLIATDFSAEATHAADYGYSLAKQIKADVILCNAVVVPAEIPQPGMVTWPMEEFSTLTEASTEELMHLKDHLVIIPGKVYHHSAAKGARDLRCKRVVRTPSPLSSMMCSKLSDFSCFS